MEALYKCPVSTCFHPTCKRLMSIMNGVTQDMHGNPLYTAVCDKMGEVITDIRKCELIYPEKKPEKNEIEPLAEEIADKIVDRIPKVIAPFTKEIKRQTQALNKHNKSIDLMRKEIRDGYHPVHERSQTNNNLIKKAIDLRTELITNGTKERNATTDACRKIEEKYGLGDYSSFESFRDAVNTIVQKHARSHGLPEYSAV